MLLIIKKNLKKGSVIPIVQLYAKAGRIDDAQELIAKLPNPTRQQLQQYVDCHK
jgi:hypothetical protein